MGVCRASNHFASNFPEFLNTVRESNNFSGTDEGEVQRVEEENYVFALVILQGDLLELSVNNSSALEDGSRLANSWDSVTHGGGGLGILEKKKTCYREKKKISLGIDSNITVSRNSNSCLTCACMLHVD